MNNAFTISSQWTALFGDGPAGSRAWIFVSAKACLWLYLLSLAVSSAAGEEVFTSNEPPPRAQDRAAAVKAEPAKGHEENKLRFLTVLGILSITGCIGGLAAGLVRNERALLWPRQIPDKPQHYDLGFLADMLIGTVAANSVQLALAAFMDYRASDADVIQKLLSLVAVGLVAGFSGPKILAGLAKKLETQVEKELRETDAKQQEEIERAKNDVKKLAETGALRAMEDPLLFEQGQLKAQEAQIEMAAGFVEDQPEATRNADDFLILAFNAFRKEDYKAAVTNAERALAANPPHEMLWRIHNLLGLGYHWQQPKGWKAGDNTSWIDKTEQHYKAAVAASNNLGEELLSKANLAFALLDAGRYNDCDATVKEVLSRESVGGTLVTAICDLARVAQAAAKAMNEDVAGAQASLNATTDITAFEYLFNLEDLPREALKRFAALQGLKPDVGAFIASVAKRLQIVP